MVKNSGCSCESCSCEKPLKIYFCPKCKSVNVRYVFGFGNLFGVVPKMKCSDCGFSAAIFPQLVKITKKVNKLKKKNKKTKQGGKK